MSEPLAYLCGEFLPLAQLAIPVFDAGFVFGATAADLVRTFHGQPFRLQEHISRFRESCRLCRIQLPVSDEELSAAAERLIGHNLSLGSVRELVLVMFATPGPIGHYAGLPVGSGANPATYGMHTFPLRFERYRRLFTDGATLVVPETRHVPAASIDPRAKMRSRLYWWIAEQEAKALDPSAHALLLDAQGHVTETAAANFLIVKGDSVVSPPSATILSGVSLRFVEELCAEIGCEFVERPMTLADCQNADEALLTGTAFCVAGVSRLNDAQLPWPGQIYRRLVAAWSNRVGLDIEAQFIGQ